MAHEALPLDKHRDAGKAAPAVEGHLAERVRFLVLCVLQPDEKVFFVADAATIGLFLAFPEIVTWLPNLIK